MTTSLSARLGTATGVNVSTLELIGNSAGNSITLSTTKTNAAQTSYIHYGANADWYIRSGSSTGNVFLQDNPNSFVYIGTSTPVSGYNFVVVTKSIFSSDVKISGVLTNNSIKMNAPTSTTGALIIKDSGGTNSSLIIESTKGAYISQFGSGLGGDVDIRSALKSSIVSIQDMGGICLIGTNTQQQAYQTTIGGTVCIKGYALMNDDACVVGNLLIYTSATIEQNLLVKGSATVEQNLLVKGSATINTNLAVYGLAISTSDVRIKTDIQPIDHDLCVQIVKSIEPKTYKKNSNQTRECGLIAQHLLEKLDDNMPNLVQEIPDETLGNLYGIDYSRLTTVLWATCRDLIKRIEVLESK